MSKPIRFGLAALLWLMVGAALAQDAPPEITPEITPDPLPEATAEAGEWRDYLSLDGRFVFAYPAAWVVRQRTDGLIQLRTPDRATMEIYPPVLVGDAFDTPESLLASLMQDVSETLASETPLLIQVGEQPGAAVEYAGDDYEGLYVVVEVTPGDLAVIDIYRARVDGPLTQAVVDTMLDVIAGFDMLPETGTPEVTPEADS